MSFAMPRKQFDDTTTKRPSDKPASPELEADGQAVFEMANLRPERAGLPFVVFISQRGGARHDVRVEVARSARVRPSEMITVAVRPPVRVIRGRLEPHDLSLLTRWIDLNRQVLILGG
jgi:hypothetical protein